MIRRIKRLLSFSKEQTHKYVPKGKPDAIILAAGMLGKKILFPKALFEHGGKTAIEHQISVMRPLVGKIIIACHESERKEIAKHIDYLGGIEFSTEIRLLDVRQYKEKPMMRNIWANCGLYFLTRKTVENFPERGSLEHDVWPYVRMKAFKHFGMWKTFGK